MIARLAVGITSAATAALVWSEWRHNILRYAVKPLASAGFIGMALTRGALDSTYGRLLLVGLILAAIGDVLLLVPALFRGGLVAFLLCHVMYGVAFWSLGLDWSLLILTGLGLGVVDLAVFRWLEPHLDADMVLPVQAYLVVITAMVMLAAGAVDADATKWILLGAFGFYVSDVAVARNQFVNESIVNRAWGLPLYYASQLILAWTVGRV